MPSALQCPLLLPTDLASLLHDIGSPDVTTFGIVQESKGFLEPGLGLSGALLQPGYVTEGDRLVVRAYSRLSGRIVSLRTELLMNTGKLVYWGAELRPKSDSSKTEKVFVMPESVIRTAAFNVTGGTVKPGEIYATMFLTRADDNNNMSYATLIADYVTSSYNPSFPQGPLRLPSEGEPVRTKYDFAGTLAGNGFAGTTDALRRGRVVMITCSVTASAVLGTRYPRVQLTEDFYPYFFAFADQGYGPGTSPDITFSTEQTRGSPFASNIVGQLPSNLYIPGPFTLGIDQNTVPAALDAWSTANVVVEEWLALD